MEEVLELETSGRRDPYRQASPRRPGTASAPGEGVADRAPHEVGHLLGRMQEADGQLSQTLPAGTRRVPASDSDRVDVAALDPVCADGQTSRAAPFAAASILPVLLNGQRQREGEAKG